MEKISLDNVRGRVQKKCSPGGISCSMLYTRASIFFLSGFVTKEKITNPNFKGLGNFITKKIVNS